MKTNFYVFVIGLALSVNFACARAQEGSQKIDTTEFRVVGVCEMCKARIENAALIKGVKFAEWNKDTQIITVIYRNDKVNKNALEEAIAEAGHSTENIRAKEEDYNKLPKCCSYRDGVETH